MFNINKNQHMKNVMHLDIHCIYYRIEKTNKSFIIFDLRKANEFPKLK
jgi:hypothetical protein